MGGGHREPKVLFNYSSSGRGSGIVEGRFTEAKKSLTLTATGYSNRSVSGVIEDAVNLKWRKLTPIECERLQTLPDNYTAGISDTQRYKCLGNGWTVDVIAHIFKNIT
jgi:site-specific DNA-cytosine methylase